jgi:hypothetical protein
MSERRGVNSIPFNTGALHPESTRPLNNMRGISRALLAINRAKKNKSG